MIAVLGGPSWSVLTAGMRALALEQKTSSPGCHCRAGGDFPRHTQTGVSSCCPHYRSHPGAVLPVAGGKQASPSRFSPDSCWQDSTGWRGGWALPQAQGTASAAKEKGHLPSPVPRPSCALPLPRRCLPLKPRVEGKPSDASPYHLHRLAGQGQVEMAFWRWRQHSQAR